MFRCRAMNILSEFRRQGLYAPLPVPLGEGTPESSGLIGLR